MEKKPSYCRWNKRFDQQIIKTCYTDVEDMERVYVYLMDGDVPICFWKGDLADYMNPDPEYKWIPLKCDLGIGKVKESWKSGMLSIKLAINNKTKNGSIDFK